ncbi:MAG: zeta toxin family protein [Prevotellaceae bacterium]|jgi:predicted ABC-type ATPase|nr:zeta toxin family protein [Prevotellaceae bacterium]
MDLSADTSTYQLSQVENLTIFSLIEKELLLSKNLKSQTNPLLTIIGGQPGCGKSTRSANIRDSLTLDSKALFIDLDELRKFHPEYKSINKKNDKLAALYTGPDAGKWSELLLHSAVRKKYNIVYESSLRNTEYLCSMIHSLSKKEGYDISLQVIITKPEISQVSTYLRYELIKERFGYGRYIVPDYHDDSVTNMSKALQAIKEQGLVSKMELYTRDKPLFQEDYKKNDIVAIANTEYNRPLTPEERKYIRESWDDVRRLMLKRNCQVDELREIDKLREPYQETKKVTAEITVNRAKNNLKI